MHPLLGRLLGDEGRLEVGLPVDTARVRLLEDGLLAEVNGFGVSTCLNLVPDAKLTELRPAARDGVSGAFASERERRWFGVFGLYAIINSMLFYA